VTAIRVEGLSELIRAADAADRETKRAVRNRLRKVGEIVRDEARSLLAPLNSRSAAGYGVSVRRAGLIAVEQRRRRVNGKRPDWGSRQMRHALLPALERKSADAEHEFEAALDDIATAFEHH
jgi:hypothetical protein